MANSNNNIITNTFYTSKIINTMASDEKVHTESAALLKNHTTYSNFCDN